MALSRFMRSKVKQMPGFVAKADAGVDAAGMPKHGIAVEIKCYYEGGFSMSSMGEAGRKMVDLDFFILDTTEVVVPEKDDLFWSPGRDPLVDEGQKVSKCIPVPDFNGTVSHYEVYL